MTPTLTRARRQARLLRAVRRAVDDGLEQLVAIRRPDARIRGQLEALSYVRTLLIEVPDLRRGRR